MATLLVRQLPESVTESEVHSLFEDFGPVVSIRIQKNGTPQCHAFVELMNSAKAGDAIRVLDGETLRGKHVSVDMQSP
jgi:RNA recognition motif-containing protein